MTATEQQTSPVPTQDPDRGEELKVKIATLNKSIADVESEISMHQDEIEDLEFQRDALVDERGELEGQLWWELRRGFDGLFDDDDDDDDDSNNA